MVLSKKEKTRIVDFLLSTKQYLSIRGNTKRDNNVENR